MPQFFRQFPQRLAGDAVTFRYYADFEDCLSCVPQDQWETFAAKIDEAAGQLDTDVLPKKWDSIFEDETKPLATKRPTKYPFDIKKWPVTRQIASERRDRLESVISDAN